MHDNIKIAIYTNRYSCHFFNKENYKILSVTENIIKQIILFSLCNLYENCFPFVIFVSIAVWKVYAKSPNPECFGQSAFLKQNSRRVL